MLDVKSKQKSKVISEMKIKRQRVNFSLEATEAKEVILMGDFNNWNPKKHLMKSDENGLWNQSVMIPPGRYEYKFLIDGNWIEDPQNDRLCP
ncbi:MAG: isoamylase early set domain-containing protein, partial [Desulfobacterales bacterium]|nr:isoamylase early set domain-containing protein [Desulfobacterales bacterium]